MTDAAAEETRTSPPTRRPLLSPRQRDVDALYASTHHQRGADDDGDGDAHPENQIGQRRCSAEERARCAAETATVMKSSTVHQRPTTRMTMMRDEPQQQQQHHQHHRQRCASQPPSSLMSGVEHFQIQRREAAVNWTPQLRTYTLHRPPTSPRRYIHDDDDDDDEAPTPTYPWHDDATPVRDAFVRTRSSSSKERASSSPSRTNSRAGRGRSRIHCVVDAQQQQHIIDYAVELARGGGGGRHARPATRQEPSPTPTRSCASRTSSTVHPHRGCSSTSSSSRRAVELDFARRQQAYADERHARLEAARRAEASAVHELCPFRPKLSVVSEALHAEQQQQHEKKKKKQRGNSCPAPRLLPSGRGAYMYFILSPRGGACLSGNVRSPRPKVPYTRYTSSQRLTNTPPPSPPPLHRHPHPSNIVSEDVSLMYRHNHQQQQHWDPHPYDGSSPPPTPRCK